MDWLTQAFPNCSQATVKIAVRRCKGNYVEAHKLLRAGGQVAFGVPLLIIEGLYFGEHAASDRLLAISKTGRKYETTGELVGVRCINLAPSEIFA
jgi:hypothetical protein